MYSWRSADAPVPYEANPRLVFERMFRGRKPIVPNWHRRQTAEAQAALKMARSDSYEQSVLDLVLEDAKTCAGAWARPTSASSTSTSTRSAASRRGFNSSKPGCGWRSWTPADPGPSKHRRADVAAGRQRLLEILAAGPPRPGEARGVHPPHGRPAGPGVPDRHDARGHPRPGQRRGPVPRRGHGRLRAALPHPGTPRHAARPEDADPISREALRQIHAWYTQLFAEMARKMKNIDEGGSSLLDNSLLLYTSYMAHGGHGTDDYPAALVGRGRRRSQGRPAPGLQATIPRWRTCTSRCST